jgi:hypothetical protein
MSEQAAFAELLRRHEELTQRFARLLHDDAGQVLTAIALQLSVLDGVAKEDLAGLTETLDDLLDRFRVAQASLGGAVVAKRGLLAALSQLARMNPGLRVDGNAAPPWPVDSLQAAFRIVEALSPKRVVVQADGLTLEGTQGLSDYVQLLATVGKLALQAGPQATTIRIYHGNSGTHR